MKKIIFCLFMLFGYLQGYSQSVKGMTSAYSVGSYSTLDGTRIVVPGTNSSTNNEQYFSYGPTGASLTASDDPGTAASVVGIPLGFTFVFNGMAYDGISISTNGYVVLGSASTTTPMGTNNSINPLATLGSLSNMISGFGTNLIGQSGTRTSELSYLTSGSAGAHVFTVQWSHYAYKPSGTQGANDDINFQIMLNESDGSIVYSYGTVTLTVGTSLTAAQAGVRSFLTDALTRKSPNTTDTNGWANSTSVASNANSCYMSPTIFPVSGAKFTFMAAPACSGTPTGGTASPAAQIVCYGTAPAAINVTGYPGATGISFQWQKSTDSNFVNNVSLVDVSDGTLSNGNSTFTPNARTAADWGTVTAYYYRAVVTCENGGGTAYSAISSYAPLGAPVDQASALGVGTVASNAKGADKVGLYFTKGASTAASSGKCIVLSNTSLDSYTPPTSGSTSAAAAYNSTTGGPQIVYTAGGSLPSSASPVLVTGLLPNTTYYAKVFEFTACGSGASAINYFNTTAGAMNASNSNYISFTTLPTASNDECSSPTNIVVNAAAISADNRAATANATAFPASEFTGANPCGTGGTIATYQAVARDLWFTVTVPANGNLTLTTGSTDGTVGGSFTVYKSTSGCGSLTYLSCVRGTSGNGSLTLPPASLTPGDVLYVRFYAQATSAFTSTAGAFTIKANDCVAPAAPTTSNASQKFCFNAPTLVYKVSDLQVTGSNIKWYSAPTGGTIFQPTDGLNNLQPIYYASQTVSVCESLTRLAVNVTVESRATYYADNDGDGVGAGTAGSYCPTADPAVPLGWVSTGSDCDDTDPEKFISGVLYVDADKDTYTVGSGVTMCYGDVPTGYRDVKSTFDDCNDADKNKHLSVILVSQPTAPRICKLAGATASVSVSTTGSATPVYKWHSKVGTTDTLLADNANYSGATSSSLTIMRTTTTIPATGTQYYCVVSGGDCGDATSNTVALGEDTVLSKAPAIKVTSVLKPTLTVCNGGTVSFSAAAGSVGVVEWQKSFNNSTWLTVRTETQTLPTNPVYTFTSVPLSTGDVYYRTKASSGSCSSVVSASVHIVVSPAAVAGTISLNNSGTVCSYQKATTKVGLVENSTTLTLNGSTGVVSWLSSTDGVKWAALKTSVSGTNGLANPNYTVSSTTLVVNNLVKNLMFKAVVVSGACSNESAATQLTVTPIAKAGALTAPKSVCLAGDLTIESAPYVGNSIAWEVSTISATEGFATIPGQSSATLNMTNIPYAAGTKFYIRSLVLSGGCFAVNSAVKTIAVDALSVGGTVTGGKLICSGANTNKLTLSGSVGKSIQWQSSSDGLTGWSDIGGATLTTYTPATVTATTYYRAVVKNGDCSVSNSTSTVLTVATAAVAGTISSTENNLCPATGTTLNLTGYSGSIQWQKTASPATGSSVWANVTGVLPAVSTGNLSASTVFRAIVYVGTSSSSNCFTQTTPEYTVTVKSLPVAKAITANVTSSTGASPTTALCITDSSKVLTEGVGYVGAIQWQMSTVSATLGWTDISGEIGASYTVNAPASGANYYRVKVTNGCTDKFSAAFTLYYSALACPASLVGKSETISNVTFGVKAYPNPYAETFKLDVTTSSEESIRVNVYDMLGKQLESREYKANEISTEEIGVNYPSGVYNIIVSQGSEVKTVRVVKR